MPVGPLLCVIDGRTHGRRWASDAARARLRRVAAKAGVRRRFAPHRLRHARGRSGQPPSHFHRALASSTSSTLGLRYCWSSGAGVLGATGARRSAAMVYWRQSTHATKSEARPLSDGADVSDRGGRLGGGGRGGPAAAGGGRLALGQGLLEPVVGERFLVERGHFDPAG
jgi:hypothetical protein